MATTLPDPWNVAGWNAKTSTGTLEKSPGIAFSTLNTLSLHQFYVGGQGKIGGYGAIGNGKTVNDGVMNDTSVTVTSATATFLVLRWTKPHR